MPAPCYISIEGKTQGNITSGEMLPKVTLKCYRASMEGRQEHFFTTTLTNATIVGIHCQDASKQDFTQLIAVSMAYRKIDWEHPVAGLPARIGEIRKEYYRNLAEKDSKNRANLKGWLNSVNKIIEVKLK